MIGIILLAVGIIACIAADVVMGIPLIIIGIGLMAMPSTTTKKQTRSSRKTSGTKKTPVKATPSGAPAADAYAFQGTPDRYFEALLQGCFPEYTLGRNVSVGVKTSGGSAWECKCGTGNTGNFCSNCGSQRPAVSVANAKAPKVSFVLYQGQQPACAIILAPKNEWNTEEVLAAMESCQNSGIPCLRFYEEFRNEANYVINRVRKALS